MAATPFVGNLVVSYETGAKESIPATMSDVNDEEWVAQDGGDYFIISGAHGNAALIDVTLSGQGVDTKTAQIRVNGKVIPTVVLNGANLGTTVGRQFQQTPLQLPSGARLEFIQKT